MPPCELILKQYKAIWPRIISKLHLTQTRQMDIPAPGLGNLFLGNPNTPSDPLCGMHPPWLSTAGWLAFPVRYPVLPSVQGWCSWLQGRMAGMPAAHLSAKSLKLGDRRRGTGEAVPAKRYRRSGTGEAVDRRSGSRRTGRPGNR